MDYYIEVDGVVPQSDYNRMIVAKTKLIKELKEKLEAVESKDGDEKVEEPRLLVIESCF